MWSTCPLHVCCCCACAGIANQAGIETTRSNRMFLFCYFAQEYGNTMRQILESIASSRRETVYAKALRRIVQNIRKMLHAEALQQNDSNLPTKFVIAAANEDVRQPPRVLLTFPSLTAPQLKSTFHRMISDVLVAAFRDRDLLRMRRLQGRFCLCVGFEPRWSSKMKLHLQRR